MATGQDIVKLDDMVQLLFGDMDIDVVSPEAIQVDMIRRIMGAETMEEAFQDFAATPMEDVEGVVLDVTGVAWAKSAYEDGAPIYALVRCVPEGSRKTEVVSCGGATVITRLRWAELHNAMPFKVTFVREQSRQNPEYHYWTARLVSGKASGK